MIKYILIFFTLCIPLSVNCQEVIPFELKEDNRIYLKVSVNQSSTLSFVFDLGANITVINKTRLEQNKTEIKFDSIVSNQGINGISHEQISHNNSVQIGSKTYKNIDILGILYSENDILDGIIGWDFFQDKIVRIDYEGSELTIYDELPELSQTYNKTKLKFIGNLPYVESIVYNGRKKAKIWSMLDIGYNGAYFIYYDEVMKNNLIDKFPLIGESTTHGTDGTVSKSDLVLLPKVCIAGFEIYNLPTNLTRTKVKSTKPAILGGNLLKRFHTVLDFKNKEVYMKPNMLINSQF